METKKIILIHPYALRKQDIRAVTTYEIPGEATFGELFRAKRSGEYCGSYSSYDVADPKQAAYYRESLAEDIKRRPGVRVYVTVRTEGGVTVKRISRAARP